MKLLDTWVGVNETWCRARLMEGWGGLIQGAGSGGRAAPLYPTMQRECARSLSAMRRAGGLTAAYFNTNPWYSPQQTLDDALRAIGAELEHLSFLVIDHELSPVPATRAGAQDLDDRTHELIRLTRDVAAPWGIPIIGYSADWFLGFLGTLLGRTGPDNLRNWYALDGYWHARYDNIPDLRMGTPTWAMAEPVVGKQYKGTTILGGKVTDLNVFDGAWIHEITQAPVEPTPPAPPEEPEKETNMILLIGREGDGGGIFTLDGKHLSLPELTSIRWVAEQQGADVLVQKVDAHDPFFTEGAITFPHGIPRP
ncbi:hypothetical protein LCGC14_0657680 [marine sediment metagenome]|uniref:Uncharacterized protein n=1 Tax=marine sediment metagenome TaxID=412755 RepID=A0A0F9QZJ7_9ZZZZ